MKKQINQLFIILTPFQKVVLSQLFLSYLRNEHSLVLLGDYVDKQGIICEMEFLKNHEFSRKELFNKPFKYFNKTKRNIAEIKKFIRFLNSEYSFSEDLKIFIGTDKDIFTQLFLNELYSKAPIKKNLTLVDEGIGYYVNLDFKDRVISFIYRILTPIIFKDRLYYIKRIGIHPKINTIYLRAPELLKKRRKGVNYIKFDPGNQTKLSLKNTSDSILLFSFPNQDHNITTEYKLYLIKEISSHLETHKKRLTIKPHPREDLNALMTGLEGIKNIIVLDNKFIGENINYFDYELVLNFFSSIILDLINKNYPKNKILTIGFTKEPKIHLDKDLKYCHINNFRASDFIIFE